MDIGRLTTRKWDKLNALRKVTILAIDILVLTLLKTYLQLISTLNNIYVIYNNFNYLKRARH